MTIGARTHGPQNLGPYQFAQYWRLHFYGCAGELILDGQLFPVHSGCVAILPPGVTTELHFETVCRHPFAHFTLSASADDHEQPILAVQDLGDDFPALHRSFEQAFPWYTTHPQRAEVRLWDILWELVGRTLVPADQIPGNHPAVLKTIQEIEARLYTAISIEDLAQEAGLSHNHLTRLFRTAFGKTIVGYIQERRITRARYLLLYSTLPIKAIAAEVGIPDLHLFNKTMRRVLGASPRQVRASRLEAPGPAQAESPATRLRQL